MPERMDILSLDDILARDRRARASEFASATLGRGRHHAGDPHPGNTRPGGRGVGKRPAPGSGIGISANGKWPHDLHHKVNANTSRVSKLPTTISPAVARSLQNNRLFAALHGPSPGAASFAPPTGPKHNSGISIRGSSTGLSIKGSAGPYVVEAANFAPGTTAEDVKMAMVSLGKILSCIVLSAAPWVTCEIVFETKQAAENCVAQYHNQLADGRLLSVTLKHGPPVSRLVSSGNIIRPVPQSYIDPNAAREEADRQRRQANVSFQDGCYGVRPPPLYSDALVQRGRGFAR